MFAHICTELAYKTKKINFIHSFRSRPSFPPAPGSSSPRVSSPTRAAAAPGTGPRRGASGDSRADTRASGVSACASQCPASLRAALSGDTSQEWPPRLGQAPVTSRDSVALSEATRWRSSRCRSHRVGLMWTWRSPSSQRDTRARPAWRRPSPGSRG